MKINNILKNFDLIKDKEIAKLEEINFKYPFFQTSQILLSKGLLNIKSIRYDEQIKKAAVYSRNRKKLFLLIMSKEKNNNVKNNDVASNETPLKFEENDTHSFSQWLSLSKVKKIRNNSSEDKIINNFIEHEHEIKIKKNEEFFKPTTAAKKSLQHNNNLITPTLAEVYLKQGHFDKAISAYEKLILKYPQKSTFFAEKIKLIKNQK
tara:strand:- start:255 stop:875 length:621 start_codon:yes stop_codon:yes gene_type:complete